MSILQLWKIPCGMPLHLQPWNFARMFTHVLASIDTSMTSSQDRFYEFGLAKVVQMAWKYQNYKYDIISFLCMYTFDPYEFIVGNIYFLLHFKEPEPNMTYVSTNRCRKKLLTVITYFSVKVSLKKELAAEFFLKIGKRYSKGVLLSASNTLL